nr:MAG: cytochrome c biogenesis protein CcmG, thiol:disulfide interchange protein DsbE [Candidatus Kentron sp. TUN]VFK69403.1 MAG: cytochrome c biogenesis protein CcmG, thiol:disulfide interchange protein DsbE [Candidatus Kentron sp. TUN]
MKLSLKNSLVSLFFSTIFIALIALLWAGLGHDPRLVPSPLVGKSLPAFELPRLRNPKTTLNASDFSGKVSLLNVWATWCVSCRMEHGFLMKLAKTGEIPIFGLNYKDDRATAVVWLDRKGDPYTANIYDPEGDLGLDLGVYGTPESFIINAEGVIAYKHVGPITHGIWQDEILPLIHELRK